MKKYIVFLFFSLLLFKGYSQFSLKGEAQNYIYAQNPTIKYPIDTSLKNFEEYNFENTETWEFANTSILGSAQIPLSFISKKNIGFQDGNIFFNNYHYAIDKIKYYEVQKFPFSQINYLIGSKLEQSARITHAQNIKNRFLFGIDAMGLSSSGFYDLNQRSRNFGFSFYGHYASMNNRYHLKTNFTYSSVKINELGGIQEDILTTPSQNKLFFTNLIDDATTKQSQFNIELINSYHFGVFSIDSLNDTTKVRYFYPTFGIDYSIGTSIVKQSFVDYATDSSYGVFYQNKDSLYYSLKYHNLPHKLSFTYFGKAKDANSYLNFKAIIAIQHNNIEVKQDWLERTYNNVLIEAKILSNEKVNSPLTYNVSSSLFLAGYNQFDWNINAEASYQLKKIGQFSAGANIENASASWIEQFYISNTLKWQNDFKKKQNTHLFLHYHLKKYQINAGFSVDFLNQYIYFSEQSTPIQTNAKINYWQFFIQKDTHWKIWHWNNFIGFQNTNHREILPLPSWFIKTSLYAEFKLFKKNMLLSTGFDLRYQTAFNARAWNPIIAQFYIQQQETMNYTPVVDVFLSTKIKSLRAYVKMNYVNEGLFQKNNYKALHYPSNGRTFSIGLSWRFFE